MSKVFAFGDTHFPYNENLNRIYKAIKQEKPDVIIHNGDLLDQYMFSRYGKDYDELSPKKELNRAKKMAVSMWKRIKKIAPKARRIQLLGNHDIRILKQTKNKFPEVYFLINDIFNDLYTFKGVETMKSDRDYIDIDNVIYCHGWKSKHTAHFGKSVVRGHSHKADLSLIQCEKSGYRILFEMQVGGCGDERAVPLSYPASKKTGWKLAYGIIIDGHPYLKVV